MVIVTLSPLRCSCTELPAPESKIIENESVGSVVCGFTRLSMLNSSFVLFSVAKSKEIFKADFDVTSQLIEDSGEL